MDRRGEEALLPSVYHGHGRKVNPMAGPLDGGISRGGGGIVGALSLFPALSHLSTHEWVAEQLWED
jgi:hypothetical protein